LAPQNAEGVDAGESEGKLFGIGMDGGGRFESQKVTRTNAILKEDVLLWRIYGIQQCSGHAYCINAILNETRIGSERLAVLFSRVPKPS
jgi:hypothetical protein